MNAGAHIHTREPERPDDQAIRDAVTDALDAYCRRFNVIGCAARANVLERMEEQCFQMQAYLEVVIENERAAKAERVQ